MAEAVNYLAFFMALAFAGCLFAGLNALRALWATVIVFGVGGVAIGEIWLGHIIRMPMNIAQEYLFDLNLSVLGLSLIAFKLIIDRGLVARWAHPPLRILGFEFLSYLAIASVIVYLSDPRQFYWMGVVAVAVLCSVFTLDKQQDTPFQTPSWRHLLQAMGLFLAATIWINIFQRLNGEHLLVALLRQSSVAHWIWAIALIGLAFILASKRPGMGALVIFYVCVGPVAQLFDQTTFAFYAIIAGVILITSRANKRPSFW